MTETLHNCPDCKCPTVGYRDNAIVATPPGPNPARDWPSMRKKPWRCSFGFHDWKEFLGDEDFCGVKTKLFGCLKCDKMWRYWCIDNTRAPLLEEDCIKQAKEWKVVEGNKEARKQELRNKLKASNDER